MMLVMYNRLKNLAFRLPVPIVNSNIRAKILRSKGAKIGEYVSINRHSTFGNPSNIEVGDDSEVLNVRKRLKKSNII